MPLLCCHDDRLQKNVKAASDVDYPAYGVTGPAKDKVGSPGDRKLAQSAQMYHYQHQKQQMIAMEKYAHLPCTFNISHDNATLSYTDMRTWCSQNATFYSDISHLVLTKCYILQ